MPRPPSPHPTDGELEILRVLWSDGPLGLSVLCERLRAERDVATTTVATMLRVMADKGLVRRDGAGRTARWSAAVSHSAAAGGMVRKLVDGVFDGSAKGLVAHLVQSGGLNESQLAELRGLLDESKGRAKKTGETHEPKPGFKSRGKS